MKLSNIRRFPYMAPPLTHKWAYNTATTLHTIRIFPNAWHSLQPLKSRAQTTKGKDKPSAGWSQQLDSHVSYFIFGLSFVDVFFWGTLPEVLCIKLSLKLIRSSGNHRSQEITGHVLCQWISKLYRSINPTDASIVSSQVLTCTHGWLQGLYRYVCRYWNLTGWRPSEHRRLVWHLL